jgi:hypothetical protein
MRLLKKSYALAHTVAGSIQVQIALASCSVVGMILAAGAGSQWN